MNLSWAGKADIMKPIELGVMALIALLAIFLVFRPLMTACLRPSPSPAACRSSPDPMASRWPPAWTARRFRPFRPGGGLMPALAGPAGNDIEKDDDIAQVDGQVSASQKKVVDCHPGRGRSRSCAIGSTESA